VFPTDSSITRRPPSLRWVPVGQVPPHQRYYEGAKTTRCHLAALRFLRACNTIYRLRPSGSLPRIDGRFNPRAGDFFFRLPFPVLRHGACEILPGSWMTLPAFAMLSDPGRAGVPCQTVHRYCSRCSENESLGVLTFRGSITRLLRTLSTLRARVAPWLRKTRFWLLAGFARRAWFPAGS